MSAARWHREAEAELDLVLPVAPALPPLPAARARPVAELDYLLGSDDEGGDEAGVGQEEGPVASESGLPTLGIGATYKSRLQLEAALTQHKCSRGERVVLLRGNQQDTSAVRVCKSTNTAVKAEMARLKAAGERPKIGTAFLDLVQNHGACPFQCASQACTGRFNPLNLWLEAKKTEWGRTAFAFQRPSQLSQEEARRFKEKVFVVTMFKDHSCPAPEKPETVASADQLSATLRLKYETAGSCWTREEVWTRCLQCVPVQIPSLPDLLCLAPYLDTPCRRIDSNTNKWTARRV